MSELTSIANMPATFKEALRERVLKATLDIMPPELLSEYIDREIKAFFETEQLLTVKQLTIEVDNPEYEPSKGNGYSSYNNPKQLSRETLAFGNKMTPFRQMVWGILNEHLRPRLTKLVDDETSQVRKELDSWISQTVAPKVSEVNKDMFTRTATMMSSTMFHNAISQAVSVANANIRNSMTTMGANPAQIPLIEY